MYKFRNNSII
uniref:Uncharacterized protein n=1 Tax=Lepeophtheirus salmonis TaxID=72036 RepID=A0A0K2T7B6_LEPSM